MVELRKDNFHTSDDPIHQGYKAGAERIYFDRESEKKEKLKMLNFAEGLKSIREKYLKKNQ